METPDAYCAVCNSILYPEEVFLNVQSNVEYWPCQDWNIVPIQREVSRQVRQRARTTTPYNAEQEEGQAEMEEMDEVDEKEENEEGLDASEENGQQHRTSMGVVVCKFHIDSEPPFTYMKHPGNAHNYG